MDKFLSLDKKERSVIINDTAMKTGIDRAIIEKDLWVCWVLRYLFTEFPYKEYIVFKGGTCLSKVYAAIHRFSEDIDLCLSWNVLDIAQEDAYKVRSKRQQQFFNEEANQKTGNYLKEVWMPILQQDFQKHLQETFQLWQDPYDPQTICFAYPSMFQDPAILQTIRLEIGALAEPVPWTWKSIHPILFDVHPSVITKADIPVKAMDIHRTFFEKITILHREANRTNGNYPKRYSRHFYDVYQLIQNGVGDEALLQFDLFQRVIDFNNRFYPCNWAKYDEIMEGNCKLACQKEAFMIFKEDYQMMKKMMYDIYPDFEEIMDTIKQYEVKMNYPAAETAGYLRGFAHYFTRRYLIALVLAIVGTLYPCLDFLHTLLSLFQFHSYLPYSHSSHRSRTVHPIVFLLPQGIF